MSPKDYFITPYAVREHIEALKAYVPGLSIDEIRERYNLTNIVKMASNENALGASPLVQERIKKNAAHVFRYPQGGNPKLVQAIAKRHGVSPKRVIVGNGSDEIIDLLMRVRCRPEIDNIVCFKPCFGMYTVQSQICGVELRQVPLREDFSFPFEELSTCIDAHTSLVFITTPDNPSGYCPDAQQVRNFAKTLPAGCLLVIDEAYMDFTHEETFSLLAQDKDNAPDNIAFLRTFSKSYGLAGIRLGYGILPTKLADYMWRSRMPFSVNILAEEAGLAALEDTVFYSQSIAMAKEGREQLSKGFLELGCFAYTSHANFIMFAPPKGKDALDIFEALLQKGFILRPLKSYGMPQLLRISVGTAQENAAFLHALAQVLA